MRNWIQMTILITTVLTTVNRSGAQWVQITGPSGYTYSIAASSDGFEVLAGTQDGIFLSTNAGTSWTQVNNGLTNFDIRSLVISGDDFFAGTNGGGVFRSSDNGASWRAVDAGLTNLSVNALAISGANILAGTGAGVFRSTDDGGTWIEADSNLIFYGSRLSISCFALSGNDLFAGTLQKGVFRSTDNGVSWTQVDSGLTNVYIASLVVSGTTLYAGTEASGVNSGVFVSTNNGSTWTAAGRFPTSYYPATYALTFSGTSLIAGTSSGIFVSTNYGTSWVQADTGLTSSSVFSLASYGNSIFAGTMSGVFLTTDGGKNWVAENPGLTYSYAGLSKTPAVYALALSGTEIFAATDGGIFLSNDDGSTWTQVDTALIDNSITFPFVTLAVSGKDIFTGTKGKGVYLSTNNGQSWSQIGLPSAYITSLAIEDTNIFAGTEDGLFLSSNKGESWNLLTGSTTSIYCLAINDTNLFAGGVWGIDLSTNNGATRKDASNGLASGWISELAVLGSNLFAGSSQNNGIFLSTNSGANWTPIDSGFLVYNYNGYPKYLPAVNTFVTDGVNLFAGTNCGVFVSSNNGTTWKQVDTGLVSVDIRSLSICGTYLFAGTGGDGVWRRQLSEMITSVNTHATSVPRSFALFQNYPNPFNPTTTIIYQVPANEHVTLKIFDVLGRGVKTLVNERRSAGSHSVRFNASNLPSGVYFYRLEAGAYHDTKKLLLLK